MISRIWHGCTRPGDADTHEALLRGPSTTRCASGGSRSAGTVTTTPRSPAARSRTPGMWRFSVRVAYLCDPPSDVTGARYPGGHSTPRTARSKHSFVRRTFQVP
jgi:hypothetical protein